MDLQLSDKIVVITGGGRGHGESMAIALAAEGATVAVIDINTENAQEVCEKIKENGGTAAAYTLDITKNLDVENTMLAIKDKFGCIDILINNACATIQRTPFLDMNIREWDQVMAVNLRGAFNCSQSVGRIMKAQRAGRMINISSFAAGLPAAGFAAYSASKAGLESLSKVVAGELGQYGVTAVYVRPGVIETEFTKPGHAGEVGKKMLSVIASQRFGASEELARLVCFLASPLSDYINGGPITIDGGKYVCQY